MREADEIRVRRIPFEFPDDINPHWHPAMPEWSHMINGASLTMPYLEPFLIKSIQEAITKISDPAVKAEAVAFCAQEAQHYKTHRRYNELLKSNGYPELADIEKEMEDYYQSMNKNLSLQKRLAYTVGFETMTLALTRWLVGQRQNLFAGSDSRVASFVLWHMVEETEHKNVAFRVYQAITPGWFTRAIGVAHGAASIALFTRKAYIKMLKNDGLWSNFASRLKIWTLVMRFLFNVIPNSINGMMPWHNPAKQKDPQWVRDWINGYSESKKDLAPLVDTNHPAIPVPFFASENA